MRIKEITVGATIATAQYSNLQPTITVEVDGDVEEAKAEALRHITELSQAYSEEGRELRNRTPGKLVKGFCGGSIFYDAPSHTYTNDKGEVYLSSSAHAKSFAKPFDSQAIAGAMAKKFKVSPADIITMWELKAKISRDLGTALHEAIELRRRFEGLSVTILKETHIHLSPMVKRPVEELMELLPIGKEAIEAVVIDHANKHVGRVDLINITGNQTCEVIDFKTGELDSKLDQYREQLKFTAHILERSDWRVSKLKIYHYNGAWKLHEKEFSYAG